MMEWFKENLLEQGRQNGMYDLAYVLHDGKIVKHKVELKLNVKIGD